MSRKTIITRAQRKADGPRQKINASEVSRVASLILDEIEEGMEKLFVGIYWDFEKTKGGEAAANKVLKLTHKLSALVERKRRTLKGGKCK